MDQVGQNVSVYNDAIVDDHAIESLVGVDTDVLGAIAREVGDGQLDSLVGLAIRAKVPLPLPSRTRTSPKDINETRRVELAVAVGIGEGRAISLRWHRAG